MIKFSETVYFHNYISIINLKKLRILKIKNGQQICQVVLESHLQPREVGKGLAKVRCGDLTLIFAKAP